jgi:hypothetical protein
VVDGNTYEEGREKEWRGGKEIADKDGDVIEDELINETAEAEIDDADEKLTDGMVIFGEVGIKIEDNEIVDNEPTQLL